MQTPFSFLQTVTFVHLKTARSFFVVLLLRWAKGLQRYWLIALLGWPLLPRGNSASPIFEVLQCCLFETPYGAAPTKVIPGWLMHLGETLLTWNSKDKKCCLYKTPYIAAPIWIWGNVIAKILRPTCNFLQTHLQEPEFVFGSQVTSVWRDPSYHIKTSMRNFYKEIYEQKWYQKGLLIALLEELWRVPSSVSTCRLRSDLSSWEKSLRNLEE
jgi:hypothetical protein